MSYQLNEKEKHYDDAIYVLEHFKVVIFVVAYNAENHITATLNRIPKEIASHLTEIYVIDDHSKDKTYQTVKELTWSESMAPLKVYQTPFNQGYGGNQKLGYSYALAKNYDIVVLLHGDGQYAPEALPYILAPYRHGADAVFGSRFKDKWGWGALRGGMPLYKWIGNRILTNIQNLMLNTRLSEMHSGYRSYRTSALNDIPFLYNSNGFDFDADIIVQLTASKKKIVEVPIPTYYGNEICHVNGLQYAWNCIKTALKYRFMQVELFYDPKFDIRTEHDPNWYTAKHAKTTVHSFINNLNLPQQSRLLDVGGGTGHSTSKVHAEKGTDVTCADLIMPSRPNPKIKHVQLDLDEDWSPTFKENDFDVVFALDVIEHLKFPEDGLRQVFRCLKPGGKLYASTGNVAFLPVRLMLLLGHFNYGRKGILDLTHKRLFTPSSFRRLLKNSGFQINRILPFGFPLLDITRSNSKLIKWLDLIFYRLARIWPRLFSYQILIECTRTASHKDLMENTFSLPRQAFTTLCLLLTLTWSFTSFAERSMAPASATGSNILQTLLQIRSAPQIRDHYQEIKVWGGNTATNWILYFKAGGKSYWYQCKKEEQEEKVTCILD